MEDVLAEFNCQKDHNSLMQDKIADLEMRLKQSKVILFNKKLLWLFLYVFLVI